MVILELTFENEKENHMHKMYEEFRDIYEKEFGIRLSDVETRLKADNLLKLFKIILKSTDQKGKNSNDHEHKSEKDV